MSVIAEFRVSSTDFELGRILSVRGGSTIELERLVPLGGAAVPLFWIHNSTRESFVESIKEHPAVNDATEVDVFEDRALFTLDWDASQDCFFDCLQRRSGQLLGAVGTIETWEFELRFPSHENLTEFTNCCESADITLEMDRIYNPTDPDAGPWYGLTEPQREAMSLAVRMGYYDIPRGCTTKELAERLDISDQAVTERLRRAIVSLVTNTLAAESNE